MKRVLGFALVLLALLVVADLAQARGRRCRGGGCTSACSCSPACCASGCAGCPGCAAYTPGYMTAGYNPVASWPITWDGGFGGGMPTATYTVAIPFSELPPIEPAMTPDQARALLARYGGESEALKATHPDRGGEAREFVRVQEARRVLGLSS